MTKVALEKMVTSVTIFDAGSLTMDRKVWLSKEPSKEGVLEMLKNKNGEITGARLKGVSESDIRDVFRNLEHSSTEAHGAFNAVFGGNAYKFGFRYYNEESKKMYSVSRGTASKFSKEFWLDVKAHSKGVSAENLAMIDEELARFDKAPSKKELQDENARLKAQLEELLAKQKSGKKA